MLSEPVLPPRIRESTVEAENSDDHRNTLGFSIRDTAPLLSFGGSSSDVFTEEHTPEPTSRGEDIMAVEVNTDDLLVGVGGRAAEMSG
jgi:hypothetical protein